VASTILGESGPAKAVPAPGLLLWSDIPTKEFLELVELAEVLGYHELWYTDIRFYRDCYMGLALAAKHSQKLLLGPGVSEPYTRHPAQIAAAIATLDDLSDGRAQLGLGTGTDVGVTQLGIAHERPVRALREAIELIRAILGGDTVNYIGEMFRVDAGRLNFQTPRPGVPIYVATHSPQVLRLSGRMADGVLLANIGRRQALQQAVDILRAAEIASARPAGSVAIHLRLETCISEDEERAVDVMRNRFAARLVATYPRWDYLSELGVEPGEQMREAAAARDRAAVAACLTAADVRSSTLVGSASSVIKQLREVLIPEVTRVTIRPMAIPGDNLQSTVSVFARTVWPAVAGDVLLV
jgi:5,10-methylenetetrahydromethanopterin reductase